MPEGVGYSGSNVIASTGLELNYVGNHCYAHSGAITVSNSSATTMLNFTTGKELIVAQFSFGGPTVLGDPTDGCPVTYEMLMNGESMLVMKIQTNPEAMQASYNLEVVIPPFTNVLAKALNANGGQQNSIIMSGRLYK